MLRKLLFISALCLMSAEVQAEEFPSLEVVWPQDGTVIELGDDPEMVIGVVVKSNFALLPAGQCGDNPRCGHVHMKIDPEGNDCDIPDRNYNSMNSDFGGDLLKARFGHCANPEGPHVIGVLLADDRHQPVLVDGKPVTALVTVETKVATTR
ncbi:hypothetical protein [Roseibium aggregatum]|uniref:Uncharacterized protein n=1 Tax=Roseibium aggregatum TaxID=187304 RepID=A0A939EFM8_9HYPH|nr:hypothetical protein [Roseibium aggregatum]MBN9671841.1 hypothetical protein [Roseibium aggregatum]